MRIEIKELKKADHKKAVAFTITGMHFHWYVDSRPLLQLYGKYFWNMEITRATQILAAYEGDTLAGVLLAEIYGENKAYPSFGKSLYVKMFDALLRLFSKEGAGLYEQTNRSMLCKYKETWIPDGEIIFLAADPGSQGKGIGSALLKELARREQGKRIFLFTDDACTYSFYDRREFRRAAETKIVLDMGRKTVPLRCFLYDKVL